MSQQPGYAGGPFYGGSVPPVAPTKPVERTPVRLILLTCGLLILGMLLVLLSRRDNEPFTLILGAVFLITGGNAVIATVLVGHFFDLQHGRRPR